MASNDPQPATPAASTSGGRSGTQGSPRTRRRGAVLEQAILDAAWDELAAVGFSQVTMAGVAARAGTNKAALYRRWPNRTELLLEAISRQVVPLGEQQLDTGSLRGDVIAVLQAMNRRCGAAQTVPDPGGELAAYLRLQAVAEGFDHMALALGRAEQRGEIAAGGLSPLAARLPVNVLHSELCLSATPVGDQLITEIVDGVFLPLVDSRRPADATSSPGGGPGPRARRPFRR
ncbi:MAG TPA: TetR/AcrR family transcriptional regulator [Streptosporangiaceae bacterium]|nr:TetR/AcrR family transcriptional regulator [Streptosporangiaceae bacterium]